MRFLVGRLAWGIAVIAFTAFFAYGGMRALRPDLYPGQGWSKGVRADLERVFLEGDLGDACFQIGCPPLGPYIREFFPADIYLLLGALAIALLAGFLSGVWCATRPRSRAARALEGLAVLAMCTPVYAVALGSLLLFAPFFGLVPLPWFFDFHTYVDPFENPWTFFRAMLVPWLITALPLFALVLRLTLGLTVETLHEDYVRTARAKGLSERIAIRRHAAPNAYGPVANFTGVYVPIFVLNMMLVETVFNVPGVFRFIRKAAVGSNPNNEQLPPDYESLQALSLYTAVFIVLATLLVDIVLRVADPRIRRR